MYSFVLMQRSASDKSGVAADSYIRSGNMQARIGIIAGSC